jgi:hypothetical protein
MTDSRPSVYLPENEPYLGREPLYVFDRLIPLRLEEHKQIAPFTDGANLTDLQRATIEIVPQAVSVALAIRELIRQAYLFPAFVLLRPLIERTATVAWLRVNPAAVVAWHAGWPVTARPRLPRMLTTLLEWDRIGGQDPSKVGEFSKLLHKIVHGDPSITYWNVEHELDGRFTHGMGKMLTSPGLCDFVTVIGLHYFSLVTKLAREILVPNSSAVDPGHTEPGATEPP